MAKATRIVGGVLRTFEISADLPTIYAQNLEVVASGAGAGQIDGPVNAGVNVTIPNSGTYTGDDLAVYINGLKIEKTYDYNYVGSPPRTQVSFTFSLIVGDRIQFFKQRDA